MKYLQSLPEFIGVIICLVVMFVLAVTCYVMWLLAQHQKAQKDLLRVTLVDLISYVDSAPIASGVCCCGDSMEKHTNAYDSGHTPYDEWDYSWFQQKKELNNVLERVK